MANLYINDTPGVTRVAPPVQARYACSTGQALTANVTPINFDTKDIDTDNAVTTGASWKFTCPVGKGGTYTILGSFAPASAASCYLYKNGAQQKILATYGAAGQAAFAINVDLSPGDYIDIRSGSSISLQSGVTLNWIAVTRIPDTNVSAGQSAPTVAASYTSTSTAAVANGTSPVDFNTKVVDTHSAVTTGASWKFTCPAGQGGTYIITGGLTVNAAMVWNIWKNGSKYRVCCYGAGNSLTGIMSVAIDLVPGDYIDIRATGAATLVSPDSTYNTIQITKAPDQATAPVIRGYTPVVAKYGNSTNQSLPNQTIINFDTKEIDSDNAVTTGASWKFTCPVGKGGSYIIAASTTWSVGSGNSDSLVVFKNGSQFRVAYGAGSTTAFNTGISFAIIIDLLPGDYISVVYSSPSTATLQGGVQYNWITIQSLSTYVSNQDTGWITATLTNSWQNYVGYTVKYRKINGVVYVQGVLNLAGGQGVTGTSAFTLPVGYRPAQSTNKAAVATSYYLTTANYQPDGTVICAFENVLAAYLDVSHCFPADG